VDLKDVATTILLRMSAVYDVEPAVLVQQSWPILAILLLWKLHLAMVWDLAQWLELQGRALLHPLLVDLALVVVMVNTSVVLQVLMHCHPVWALRLELIHL
jgi:hypothetical protein